MPVLQMRKQVQRRKALCPQSPMALKREGPPPMSSFLLQVTLAAHFSRLRELLWGLFFNHVTSPWYHLQADVSGEGPGVRRGLITELGVSTQRRPRRIMLGGGRASLFRRLGSQPKCQGATATLSQVPSLLWPSRPVL